MGERVDSGPRKPKEENLGKDMSSILDAGGERQNKTQEAGCVDTGLGQASVYTVSPLLPWECANINLVPALRLLPRVVPTKPVSH